MLYQLYLLLCTEEEAGKPPVWSSAPGQCGQGDSPVTATFPRDPHPLSLPRLLPLSLSASHLARFSCGACLQVSRLGVDFTGRPCFIVLCKYCTFYKWKVCGNPATSKSISSIFPATFAYFLSLCHILVILTRFQTFYYYYICYGDL